MTPGPTVLGPAQAPDIGLGSVKQEPHYPPAAIKSEYLHKSPYSPPQAAPQQPHYLPPEYQQQHQQQQQHHAQHLQQQQLSPRQPSQASPPGPASVSAQTFYGHQPSVALQYQQQQQPPPPQTHPAHQAYIKQEPFGAAPHFGNTHHRTLSHPQYIPPSLQEQQRKENMPPRRNTQQAPPPPEIDPSPVRTKFPTARIKRIMQADEEVGKVAQQTPIAVGKALEIFMINVVTAGAEIAKEKNSKRVTAQMLKQVIETDGQYDFLADIAAKVGEDDKKRGGSGNKAETSSEEEMEVEQPKKKVRGGRKKKAAT
ncbi:hypothetical protein ACHAPP_006449 [Verticillium nonalfalfae]